jgi:hypothetical protein
VPLGASSWYSKNFTGFSIICLGTTSFFIKKYFETQFSNIMSLVLKFNLLFYGDYLTSLPKKVPFGRQKGKGNTA